jgi:PilZ domain
MKNDKRKAPRRTLRHRALVVGLDHTPIAGCFMSDVSDSGAQLKLVDATIELPDDFALILAKGGKVHRRCTVVWRDKDRIGVRFSSAHAHA